jgi:type IV pilus assembly protein PilN
MRIALNLASRPFADQGPALKLLRIAMGVLLLLSLLLALGIHLFHEKAEEARAREHSLDGRIAVLKQERLGRHQFMQRPDNAQLMDHVVILNQLFDEKAFSWTLAMEDLETVLPGGVQVSTIEPVRAKDGHITLHLRVIGPRDRAVELVRNLEHSRHFILPRIVGENAETSGGPNERLEPISASNRVNFDLLAEYNPATPEARKADKSTQQTPATVDSKDVPVETHPAPEAVNPGRPPYTDLSRPMTSGPKPNPGIGGRP